MWTERISGLGYQRSLADHRDPFEHDRTRVIHSSAFRRLQGKTQILATDSGDFHRTRLTHSLEVDSIGRSILRNLLKQVSPNHPCFSFLPSEDLISAICLLHDIGHPPFGHGGEVALNYIMHVHGGFESNAQSLRLLTKTDNNYKPFGLDLTRRVLLGILKYPVARSKVLTIKAAPISSTTSQTPFITRLNDWFPPKSYYESEQKEVSWLLAPFEESDQSLFQSLSNLPTESAHGNAAYHSFDCSIMDIADNIAYGVHDLEDAIHLKLIQRERLITTEFQSLYLATPLRTHKDTLINHLFSDHIQERKQAIGELVNYFITACQVNITHLAFKHPLLAYQVSLTAEASALLNYFIQVIYQEVIDSQNARIYEHSGQQIILKLFETFKTDPLGLLDNINRERYAQAVSEQEANRVISDYIANMTDEHTRGLHRKLLGF